jgi:hypothetical protein
VPGNEPQGLHTIPLKKTSRLDSMEVQLQDSYSGVQYEQVPLSTVQSPAKVEGPPYRLDAKCVMDHFNMQTC